MTPAGYEFSTLSIFPFLVMRLVLALPPFLLGYEFSALILPLHTYIYLALSVSNHPSPLLSYESSALSPSLLVVSNALSFPPCDESSAPSLSSSLVLNLPLSPSRLSSSFLFPFL